MKKSFSIVIAILFISVLAALIAGDVQPSTDNLTQPNLVVPPTGTAVLGSKESMSDYQNWLDLCASDIIAFPNTILNIFGLNGLNWTAPNPSASEAVTTSPTIIEPAATINTPLIRESPGMTTIQTITGQSGKQIVNVTVPSNYWELSYTADPLVTGGQDSHSATGTNSAVFPTLSIKIMDASDSSEIETIEPPGGLDITLWQRAGDPRPWSEKFYQGNNVYTFDITARRLKSYVIEIRVPNTGTPVQTPGQAGTGTPSESPTVVMTNTNPTQNYNPPPSETPQRTYVVAVSAQFTGWSSNCMHIVNGVCVEPHNPSPTLIVTYGGGQDAAYLQFVTVSFNGVNLGDIRPENG